MRISKSLTFALLAVAVVVALTACSAGNSGGGSSGTTGGSSGGATVTEKNFAFDPASLTVNVGDTVTFTNADSATHNVKIDGKNLGDQAPGASVTWTATKAGTFPYACTIHPSMTGEIVVK